jgi:hypothetical protein
MSQPEKRKFKIIDRLFFFDVLLDRRARPILIYVTSLVLIGGALFHWLEGWDWLDSFYFVVITLTTVGYGDFSPTTPLTKIITIFFGVNGIIVMMMLYDLIRRLRHWELPDNEESTGSQA